MKVTSIIAALAATAIASVHATGLVGLTCPDGTAAPTTTAPHTPDMTTTAPPTPGQTTTAPPTPGQTTTAPPPGQTTTAPPPPGQTTTAPPPGQTTTAPPPPDATTQSPVTPDPTTLPPVTPDPTTLSPVTPDPTTTAPPAAPVNCELYDVLTEPAPWTPCAADSETGVFYRTKFLSIKTPAANGGKACADTDDASRTAKEKCDAIDCVAYASAEEDPGAFGECTDNGDGKFFKSKILGIKTPAQNGGQACAPESARKVSLRCDAVNCLALSPQDDKTPFDAECKDVGGVFKRSRVLGIKEQAKYGGTCLETDRMDYEVCTAVDCVPNGREEDPGAFSDCTDDGTGVFYKSKTVGIKTPAQFGGRACTLETVTLKCEPENCVPFNVAEDQGEYGECTQDAVTTKYVKSKVLGIKTPAKYGGTCLETDRTVTAPCAGIDCVLYTADEDTGPFGACEKDASSEKYYKSKVLDIKTPAKFGGLCPAPEKRTYRELCPAVNCVAVAEGDDTGAFGVCADDGTGKWYKSKVLAVQTPASNGGTCLEADRTVKELCAAVDCVAYTPDQDPGAFGECMITNSGKYFKSKVLGIKIAPQYGGVACESDETRTFSVLCPPENCVPVSPEQATGPYSACADDGTGKFRQFRYLPIRVPAKYGGSCRLDDRIDYKPCLAVNCVAYTAEEDPGQFGECKDDGSGKFAKSKVLGIKTEAKFGGSACESEDKRTVSEACPAVNCVPYNVAEDQGEYGECVQDPATSKYVKSKVLGVKEEAKFGGTCLETDRTVTAPCAGIDCVVNEPNEDTGPFGACEKDVASDKYYKAKVLGIKTPAKFGGLCPEPEKRTLKEQCPAVNCVAVAEGDDTGAFGVCTQGDATGKYYKSKVLAVKTPAANGGTCLEADRTVKELCAAVNCVAYTPDEDPSDFGECKDNGFGKFFKSKILGIKVPAQYGGLECESADKRTYAVPCPAENCVPLAATDDNGAFGACQNDGSGKFYKSRVLGVKTPAKNGGTCLDSDRTIKELCPAVNCVAYTAEEDPGQFGVCKDDGSGKFAKSKVLGIKIEAAYGGTACESEAKRTVSESCPAVNCVPYNVAEDQGEYGECVQDPATSKYVKSKVLGVKEEAKFGGTCLETDRTVTAPCAGVDCEINLPSEDTGPFGACEKDAASDTYYKSKVLGIKTPAKFGGLCPIPEKRTYKELCPAVNCVALAPEQDTGAFGACTKESSTGKYYKSKVLGIKTPAANGGTCLESDRTVRELCAAVNCVAYTATDDPGTFGECKDNGSGKFFKSKVLGIKTPAQYGGNECAPEAQRTVSELCPPVNCVPLAPQDDKGAFGACINDGMGKFFKSRVLGVKTPAQNGGTCLDKDRTESQLCAPVPCVVYPAAEDPGAFGACAQASSGGLYFKSKVLGIKTPAQFGGSCPAATDPVRSYKEQCLPVNCVVTKEADDKQSYSATCTQFPDKLYYRTKVLPILTQPLFGGMACPSVDARTLKQLCPNDGYCVPSDPFYDQCVPKLAQCGAKIDNKVYTGNELELIKGLLLWECCDLCTTTAGCAGYSFTPSNGNAKNNECSLKWKAEANAMTNKSGATSSLPKTVKPTKCSFNDNGFNTLPTSNLKEVATNSLAECCDACANQPKCATFNLKDGTCQLKESSIFNVVNFLFAGGWRSGKVN